MLCSPSGCNAPGAHPRNWLPRTVDECTFPCVPHFSKPRESCGRHQASTMLSSVTAAGMLTLLRACSLPGAMVLRVSSAEPAPRPPEEAATILTPVSEGGN